MKRPDQNVLLSIAAGAAWAAGLFLVLVGALLLFTQFRGKVAALVNSREVTRLHEALRSQPKNEDLKKQIRALDLELRQGTFYRLELSRLGSRAALAGLAVFLVSAHYVRRQRRAPPNPLAWGERSAASDRRLVTWNRLAVGGGGALLAFAALLASTRGVRLPAVQPTPDVPIVGTAPAQEFQSLDMLRRQWPSFRGADGSGVAVGAELPVKWDAATGAGIRWKSPIPMAGMSSPVVWSNSIFLTGADKASNCVFCFDAEDGRLRWIAAVKVPGGGRPPTPSVGDETGFSAPTAATDGERVYAIFADGQIAAFDFSGKQVWAKNIGPLENAYGYASSLAFHRDRLLVQIDRGSPDEHLSRAVALDTKTGREVWTVKRETAGSWASPVIVDFGGSTQLVMCAAPFVTSYDPETGRENWHVRCLESDVAPSPVAGSNLIVAVSPNNATIGVRPGETGAVWRAEEGTPDATSPLIAGNRCFVVNSEGLVHCFDLATGKVIWSHEYEDRFYASPVLAGNTVMIISRKGVARFFAAADELQELGTAQVGEECCASPAPVGRRLYLRGKEHLFCMEKQP